MGLHLKNLTKKIGDVATGVERQVNPFDNGATFKNATPAHPNGVPNALVTQAGRFVNNNIVKPVAQFPIDASAQLYNHVVAPAANLPTFSNPQQGPNPLVRAAAKKVGATGTTAQTIGSGIQTALTIAAPGATKAIESGVGRVVGETAPRVVLRVAPKVVSNAAIGAGFNAAAAGEQGATKGQILKAGAEGFAAALIPVAGEAARIGTKGAVRLADARTPVLADESSKVRIAPGKKLTVAEKQPVIAAQGAPKAVVKAKVVKPTDTGVQDINDKIAEVSRLYSTPSTFTGGVEDVVAQAQGRSTVAIRAANALRKSLKANLTSAENQQVSDILDNHPTDATPRAVAVAKALKNLQDQSFQIRQAIDPNVNRVQDYVTRIAAPSVKEGFKRVGQALGKVRNLSDITNLRSVFNQSRKIGKFVDADGNAVYGDPKELGLVSHDNGTLTKGKAVFKPVAVSKRELEANGAGKYEHNISRISGIYHADTGSLKVRAEALQTLSENPENFGLTTVDKAPEGSVPITKIPELQGLYGSPEAVKSLENSFGFKNASGPIGKAYDAITNVATQSIVLNPFFHGMNQLYQTGIAAGNIPGVGTGWLKIANAARTVGENDIKDYLENGGHSPDYGAHNDGMISKLTHGLSKVNTKTLAAYELRMRTALYRAGIEGGMTPKAAIENIDRFLGDSHQTSAATRRFTLFFHYFKTMGKAIGTQVAHPIEQKGSIANTAALAAITASVTAGWQQFTGNKNAYVRVPGELGLVKEGVQAINNASKGNPTEALAPLTNRINPILKEGAQQVFNKDLYTGQPVTDTGRLSHAASQVIAPVQIASKATGGRRNATELGANQLGVYTPHAKGHQATSNPSLKFLNTPKALPGNGLASQNAYFDGLKTAQKSLSGDKKATASFSNYLARSKDPNTGQTIQLSPSESIQNSASLFANDKLRKTTQQFEKSQPSHDPVWDLSDSKLKTLMQYKEQFTGDAAKKFILSQNPWITGIQNKESQFYDSLPSIPGSKGAKANSQTPVYPVFDKPTQSLLDQYDNLSGTDASNFIKANPSIVDAFAQVSDWTNQMRKAEGAPQLKTGVQADPQTQKIIDFYNTLPKNDGPKGGNATRSAWIAANPAAYKQMEDFYTQSSLQSLVKNAALDQFQGSTPDQQLLKSISSLGQYDVTKTTDDNGNTTYGLGDAFSNSSSGSSGNSARNALENNSSLRQIKGSTKLKKTTIKTGSSKLKVAKSSVSGKPKVVLKASKV